MKITRESVAVITFLSVAFMLAGCGGDVVTTTPLPQKTTTAAPTPPPPPPQPTCTGIASDTVNFQVLELATCNSNPHSFEHKPFCDEFNWVISISSTDSHSNFDVEISAWGTGQYGNPLCGSPSSQVQWTSQTELHTRYPLRSLCADADDSMVMISCNPTLFHSSCNVMYEISWTCSDDALSDMHALSPSLPRVNQSGAALEDVGDSDSFSVSTVEATMV